MSGGSRVRGSPGGDRGWGVHNDDDNDMYVITYSWLVTTEAALPVVVFFGEGAWE